QPRRFAGARPCRVRHLRAGGRPVPVHYVADPGASNDARVALRPMMVTYHYRTRRVILGLFFLLVGLAFLMDSPGLFNLSPNDIWPLLLIALGAGTLLNRARRLQVEEDRSAQLAVAEERVRI